MPGGIMSQGGTIMTFHSIFKSLLILGFVGAGSVAHAHAHSHARVHAQAQAHECGDTSPRLLALGDAYYDVKPARKPDGTIYKADSIDKQTNSLLKALDRKKFRSGSGARFECAARGSDQIRRSEFELRDISILTAHQDLILKALEDDHESRTVRANSLYLSLREHEVNIISDHELLISSRQRQRNINTGFTFFRESELSAVQNASGITLTQTFWVNGQLAGTTTWQLDS